MKDKVLNIIRLEDAKNPLTDEEIGKQLGILRETVTGIRKEAQIPDSRDRRRKLLVKDITQILKEKPSLSERGITRELKEKGYDIGKYTVGKLLEEEAFPVVYKEKDIFDRFIGYDGSVKHQLSKAKAAVLYPPKGLHTLIYGPSGVGKSFLAELMHEYALTTDNFKKDAPYFEFNCADYADNPQLLLAQLFGYAKGAFTGATEHKKGVVELCDGGILFLDEIHRLPAEGQEILFYLMDKGKFRRLGEVDTQRESHPLIIAATTENPESSLLLTFRRRIPMNIELPALKTRPCKERIQFVDSYFRMESSRLEQNLYVGEDVLKCLLSVDFPGNVGQLKADIQVGCAKAFLEAKVHGEDSIRVTMENMSENLKKQFSQSHASKDALELVTGDMVFYAGGSIASMDDAGKIEGSKIYDKLNNRYEELKQDGVMPEDIKAILAKEVEQTLSHHIKAVAASKFSRMEIANIVGEETLAIAQDIYQEAKKELPTLQEGLLFPLAIHLSAAIAHMKHSRVMADNLENVKKQYRKEYEIAKIILSRINKTYYLCLSEDEAVFFAMYLNKFQNTESVGKGKIGLIVISHGRVACGMADVANAIMGVEYAVGLEMDLKDSPQAMYEKTKQMVQLKNQGRGCILLADMGSLLTFEGKLQKELGIAVRVISRTDTQMVIEGLRKVLWTEESLEEIAGQLSGKMDLAMVSKHSDQMRKKAVLCLCITGQGAAKNIQTLIKERLSSVIRDIEVITRGYIENQKVEHIIENVRADYDIIAIVGTINPDISEYPFISIQDIYNAQGISALRKVIKRLRAAEENQLGDVILPEYIFVNPEFTYKDELLDHAVEAMAEGGYVDNRFLLSVYKREGQMTTYLRGGIAIPHGDAAFVTKPVISITKLDKPMAWDGVNTVDVIFVLALEENSKKYFEQLYQLISDEKLIAAIRNSQSSEEIQEILHLNTKPVK